jgi:hypothetical protein
MPNGVRSRVLREKKLVSFTFPKARGQSIANASREIRDIREDKKDDNSRQIFAGWTVEFRSRRI